MDNFATVDDVIQLYRPLTADEQTRCSALLTTAAAALRSEARRVGKDLDEMLALDEDGILEENLKSVSVDIVSRMIATPTDEAPVSQFSQSALGYTVSGTYLVPGGGVYIKKQELRRLGLNRQKIGVLHL